MFRKKRVRPRRYSLFLYKSKLYLVLCDSQVLGTYPVPYTSFSYSLLSLMDFMNVFLPSLSSFYPFFRPSYFYRWVTETTPNQLLRGYNTRLSVDSKHVKSPLSWRQSKTSLRILRIVHLHVLDYMYSLNKDKD